MDPFSRLIRRAAYFGLGVLIALLMMTPWYADATIWKAGVVFNVDGNTGGTMEAACTARIPPNLVEAGVYLHGVRYPDPDHPGEDSFFDCNVANSNNNDPPLMGFYNGSISVTGGCPSNSTSSGSVTCTCSAGYADQGGQCVAQVSCPSAGTMVAAYVTSNGTGTGPINACLNGCQITVQSAKNMTVGGTDRLVGTWSYDGGTSCSGVANATAGVPPTTPTCGAGLNPSTFNGQTLCLPASTATPIKQVTTTKTTNGDGSSTVNTTTTTTTNNTTTTITSSQNYNPNGTPNGSPSITGTTGAADDPTKKTDQEKFCTQFPNSPMCKETGTGVWSGTCPSFTCDGDAVQCAQARGAYALYCDLQADNAHKTLGEQLAAGNDPQKGQFSDPNNPTVIPLSGIAGTLGWLGRTCPADQTFTFQGQSIVLPFAKLCPYLEMCGAALLVMAGIVAARTIGVGHGGFA